MPLTQPEFSCSKFVFIVNLEQTSHHVLVFSTVNFEHVIAGWEVTLTGANKFGEESIREFKTLKAH